MESAHQTPYPGWLESLKVADPIILGYGAGLIPGRFGGNRSVRIDIIPVDFVANACLAAAAHPPERSPRTVTIATGSRNPLTRSLKSTYPMIFEVAVFIASGLQERLGIPLPDDEIAYIAMHVGGQLDMGPRGAHLRENAREPALEIGVRGECGPPCLRKRREERGPQIDAGHCAVGSLPPRPAAPAPPNVRHATAQRIPAPVGDDVPNPFPDIARARARRRSAGRLR